MILFFLRGEIDSDKFVKYCYGQYRELVSAFNPRLPESVQIIRDGGKPHFDTDEAHFNLSHSYGVVMLGISDSEIGVDVEKIRPVDFKKFDFIDADDEDEFFEKWTEKESWLKFTGKGLGGGLRAEIPSYAHFEHFEPFDGYHACVCAEEQNVFAYEIAIEAVE